MGEFIIQIIIGLVLIVIGIFNIKGNISSLHYYHRKRVKKEDVIPFGKRVGIGSVIIGITIILAGCLTLLNYTYISNVILMLGLVIGCILIFYAMIKYNKGLF